MTTVRSPNGTLALGNVGNPSGINQWSKRRDVEQLWRRLLEEVDVEAVSRIEMILDRIIGEAVTGRSQASVVALPRVPPGAPRNPLKC